MTICNIHRYKGDVLWGKMHYMENLIGLEYI